MAAKVVVGRVSAVVAKYSFLAFLLGGRVLDGLASERGARDGFRLGGTGNLGTDFVLERRAAGRRALHVAHRSWTIGF